MEKILKLDVPLHVDVTCYGCKRTVALSNTHEVDGRRYCHRCWGDGAEMAVIEDLIQEYGRKA